MPTYQPDDEHIGQEIRPADMGTLFSVNINDTTVAQLRMLQRVFGSTFTEIMRYETGVMAHIVTELYCPICNHMRGCRHNGYRELRIRDRRGNVKVIQFLPPG